MEKTKDHQHSAVGAAIWQCNSVNLRIVVGFAALTIGLTACAGNRDNLDSDLELPTFKTAAYSCKAKTVPMRDGMELYTEIYFPPDTKSGQKLPVVISRTPYDYISNSLPDTCAATMISADPSPWVADGYVFVAQEVRATGRNGGVFTPFFQEQNDGFDVVEWASSQSWSNGKIAMTGPSYLGAVQWQAALMNPPHLVAIQPQITAADYHDDWVARNGVFDLAFNQAWSLQFVSDRLINRMKVSGAPKSAIDKALADWSAILTSNNYWLAQLPLNGIWLDTNIGTTGYTIRQLSASLSTEYSHPIYDSYWSTIDVSDHYQNINVPALVTTAWYDLFTQGAIDNYHGMRSSGGSSQARAGTMLTVDCCGHTAPFQTVPGQINWGADQIDSSLTTKFMDHYVKGIDNGVESLPRVQLTVLVPPDVGFQGNNFVVTADDYPIPGTTYTRYYLGSNGNANTRSGDGVLSLSAPQGPVDRFDYDPANPVPTRGGNDAGGRDENDGRGAVDQSTVELRNDVLVYTSAAQTANIPIVGPVSVSFWAASSAPDTDFTAKLVDVHPDGIAHNVVDRIVRARYRNGSKSQPDFIAPGRPYQYTLTLGDTATVIKPGHRIRLEISSSNFPHYERNLNTGLSNEDTNQMAVAHQTILHDAAHPSYLQIPVAPISVR
jgi:uncharacterized protein